MKQLLILCISLGSMTTLWAQPNCKAFLYYGDTLKCKACEKLEESKAYYQFSKEFQMIADEAIALDSTYDYAYQEKSVAYLKSGDFITWKRLIDKAVELNPEDNLGYRGWCRFQFFRDYKGAIKDIEALSELVDYDIGPSVNGDYHLNIGRALCYKVLGDSQKAIAVIEKQIAEPDYAVGLYDNLHLGVLYWEQKNYDKAIEAFQKQSERNAIADNFYYLALVYKNIEDYNSYKEHLEKAKAFYLKERTIFNPYNAYFDKVYWEDIEKELHIAEQVKQ